MRSLLVIHQPSADLERNASDSIGTHRPESLLRSCGYQVCLAKNPEQAVNGIAEADGTVLHLPIGDIPSWSCRLEQRKPTPILWWCNDDVSAQSINLCKEDVIIDGILFPDMKAHELHWTLFLSFRHFSERQLWNSEKQQLLARIEERKWIDKAKGILCELKNISEAEAYDLLRKQAMNERKRMVDVATSIVRLHPLLRPSDSGGINT